MGKREWGRRRVDNQPYPKVRGREALPKGLTLVPGTQRVPSKAIQHKMGFIDEALNEIAREIEHADSREEADIIYAYVKEKYGVQFADAVWDEMVDWDNVYWIEEDEDLLPGRQMIEERQRVSDERKEIALQFGIDPDDITHDMISDWREAHPEERRKKSDTRRRIGPHYDSAEFSGIYAGSMVPLETAKHLPIGTILYSKTLVNEDGTPQRWKVNGKVQRWKRQPDRIKIPIKRGLREFDYFTNDNLGDFTLVEHKAQSE